jgi:hypothetical protein
MCAFLLTTKNPIAFGDKRVESFFVSFGVDAAREKNDTE